MTVVLELLRRVPRGAWVALACSVAGAVVALWLTGDLEWVLGALGVGAVAAGGIWKRSSRRGGPPPTPTPAVPLADAVDAGRRGLQSDLQDVSDAADPGVPGPSPADIHNQRARRRRRRLTSLEDDELLEEEEEPP